jgi:hypothetical protein
MRRQGGSRTLRLAPALAALGALLVVLLVISQIVLPRLAASRIRSRIGRYGHVISVSVSAFPALKLLWGHADSVTAHTGSLTLSPGQAAALLWEGRGVSRMTVSASSVKLSKLHLEDATLTKRGDSLGARAQTTAADVQAALPGVSLSLLDSSEGRVRVRAGGGLFGIPASVEAVGEASEGRLVAHPLGFLLEGFRLTLFSNPHVAIAAVGAAATGSGSYSLTLSALLH